MVRIAVIDDDRTLLDLVAVLFAERGWSSIPLPDAGTALAVLAADPPDAILIDLRLDGVESGWQVLHDLQSNEVTRDIPIVMWSGADDHLQARAGWLAEQGIPTIAKPFELDELYRTLDTVLARSRTGLNTTA